MHFFFYENCLIATKTTHSKTSRVNTRLSSNDLRAEVIIRNRISGNTRIFFFFGYRKKTFKMDISRCQLASISGRFLGNLRILSDSNFFRKWNPEKQFFFFHLDQLLKSTFLNSRVYDLFQNKENERFIFCVNF